MEKLKLRLVTAEELARRIENHENVDNYYAIGKYHHLHGFWMTQVMECKVKELDSTILVELYTE